MDWGICLPMLLKKNLKTELRNWRKTLIEVVILIILLVVILVNPIVRTYRYGIDVNKHVVFYPKDDLDTLNVFRNELKIKTAKIKLSLAYTPITPLTTQIIEEVVEKLQLKKAVGFDNAFLMETKFFNKTMLAAVDFQDFDKTNSKILSFTLRFPSHFRTIHLRNIKDHLWLTRCNGVLAKDSENVGNKDVGLYAREGFLQLQHQIFLSWLKASSLDLDQTIELRPFRHDVNPYDCDVITTGSNLIYILFYLCFFYPFLNLIQRFGYERENHVFVHHLKFGVTSRHHWVAHFIVAFGHFFVLILIVMIICKLRWVHDDYTYNFGKTPFWIVLIFLLLYICALIMTTMSLVCLIPVVTNAMLLGALMWIMSYAMFSIILEQTESIKEFWVNLAFLVFFNNTFAFGMDYLRDYSKHDHGYEFFILFAVLLGNILLHFLLFWHFQYFWPGRYVLRGPYDFFYINKLFSRKSDPTGSLRNIGTTISILQALSWTRIDNAPINSEVVMELTNVDTLDDVRSDKMRINNISMKIYRGEVTMILGHNGSGKTTLLSIMAGRYEPRNGIVLMKGVDIYEKWDQARHYFDVCMPESPLFAKLNTVETLLYYCGMKREKMDSQMDEMEVAKWTEYLKLAIPDLKMSVNKMTYDQKRLLFLCCSLSCGTEILLLDEPTQQMRWREANLYWHILHQEKPERAIVVTSNSVDMTDRYSDRILIMHDGMSLAYGTKFFLKSSFGLAYRLTIIKDPSVPVEPITKVIRKNIGGIMPDAILGEQVIYKISKEKIAIFQRILISLEKESETLGIKSIALFGCELNDIYMTLGMKANNQVITDHVVDQTRMHYLRDKELRRQQVSAVAFKKVINQAPSFLPLIMIFVVFFLILAIHNMSKVLYVPPKEDIYIELGLRSSAVEAKRISSGRSSSSIKKIFTPLADCSTICIRNMGGKGEYARINPRVYDEKSLYCIETTTYTQYISENSNMSYTVGGIEKNDNEPITYIAWYNQKIFHSAPVVLNLLHNLILSRANKLGDDDDEDGEATDKPGGGAGEPDKPEGGAGEPDKPAEGDGDPDKPPDGDAPPEPNTPDGDEQSDEPDASDGDGKQEDEPLADDADGNPDDDSPDNDGDGAARGILYATYLINDPLPTPLDTKVNLLEMQLYHVVLPLSVGIVMPLTVSTFIINLVEERTSQLLGIMKIAGLRLGTYWLITYVWDVLTLVAYCIFYIITMAFAVIEGFRVVEKFLVLMLLIIYGFAAVPLTYFISLFCIGSRLGAYLKACIVHVVTGLFFFVIYWDVVDNFAPFYYLSMCFPTFALLEALSNMYTEEMQEEYCHHTCEKLLGCTEDKMCTAIPFCCFDTFFKWESPGIAPSLVALVFQSFFYFGLIFWVEVYRYENIFATIKNLKYYRSACYHYDDPDVVAIKKQVAEAELREIRQYNFVVDQLECEPPKKNKSLKTVSFALESGKCLAIWGPRKSGKTHLVKQLVGEDSFCFGDIYVKGTELKYETELAHFTMGYCPQDRGQFSNFSPRQLLQIICMIRGVPENEIGGYISDVTKALDMKGFMNKRLYNLSYDMRRKILIAVAFLVNNEVIILDEPTRGLNALSRRQIWNVISFARAEGRTLIFTTVGSPECASMSDECMIFEDGEMLAYGSMQGLRQKYTHGFYLDIKLGLDGETVEQTIQNLRVDTENLHRFVTFIHEESELRSQRGNLLRYYCPVKSVPFSRVYGYLEKNRKRLNILSYLVTQGTMEDAFSNISATRLHKHKLSPILADSVKN